MNEPSVLDRSLRAAGGLPIGLTSLTNPPLASILVNLTNEQPMAHFVTLYEAKTHLSGLVDRAAAGEEIVIAKNGVPQARLVPLTSRGEPRKPANAMRIRRIAADFDAPDPAIDALFSGGETT